MFILHRLVFRQYYVSSVKGFGRLKLFSSRKKIVTFN